MTTTNDDWDCLCAIYADEDEASQEEGQHDERKVKLIASLFPNNGFCGTAYITLSSNKVAFARLVNNDGCFRYFTIALPPVIKCDFLYFSRNSSSSIDEQGGPSNLRLIWEYYPIEWPVSDKEKYRSSLAKKCNTILQEDCMSFSVIEFLENNAMSFYYKANDTVSGCDSDTSSPNTNTTTTTTTTTNTANTSNSWKTYVDRHLPDYQLVILPPEMDLMHYKTQGTLIHPQKEAEKLEKAITKKEISAGNKKDKEEKKDRKNGF
jgi:hypothetical protein